MISDKEIEEMGECIGKDVKWLVLRMITYGMVSGDVESSKVAKDFHEVSEHFKKASEILMNYAR